MTPAQLQAKLNELLALPQETEWAEFKHNNTDPQMIGEYLSALSNAAALEGQPFGYIFWGVEDGTRNIVGATFKPRSQKAVGNEDLEPWLNKLLSPKVNFRIFEFEAGGKPMVMFEVQAANTAPVAFGEIAAATETKAEYIKKRAFDKDHYKAMVIAYLKQFGEAKREDIDKLLLDKLSDALSEDQKENSITNLLQEMRKDGTIRTEGSKRWAVWRLT